MLSILSLSLLTMGTVLSGRAHARRGGLRTSEDPGAVTCNDATGNHLQAGNATTDLEVTGPCEVKPGTYTYRNVNIFRLPNEAQGGSLKFDDPPKGSPTEFFAESILIENNSSLIAGGPTAPIGAKDGVVTIHLWGAANDPGITCKSNDQCGIDDSIWTSNPPPSMMPPVIPPQACNLSAEAVSQPVMDVVRVHGEEVLPDVDPIKDCFYPYEDLDDADMGRRAYFGHKVLALSYGGTLQLFGTKGATYSGRELSTCKESDPACSGTSWVRLLGSLKPGEQSLKVDGSVDWKTGDSIVVTTTDYLPGHSEELVITAPPTVTGNTTTISFANADGVTTGLKWPHSGQKYDFSTVVPPELGLDKTSAETRAAVALLSRSIRIVSEGDTPVANSFTEAPGNYFGGHTIVRQGFRSYQVQGVEFYQLGQGGSIMHYPVHFHMARRTPQPKSPSTVPVTFVKDCSIHDSMTRWITLHGTQGVLLARNVGYLSIGHGFYLEDGTETDNKLYSNIGILARAAVDNDKQNPRRVPGILTATTPKLENPDAIGVDNFPFYSDSNNPAVFWIMNGWNDFEDNMAAGAGACGACYWFVPGAISGASQQEKWFGYASEQLGADRAGITPLQKFVGNSCSSAMNAFTVNSTTTSCNGVTQKDPSTVKPNSTLTMLPSPQAAKAYFYREPTKPETKFVDPFYWPIVSGGGRLATRCQAADENAKEGRIDYSDCSTVKKCANGPGEPNCDVTVLDDFTTSFNWAQQNFAAIWMRPFWSLVINSVITDVQNGGVNFVTSGDFSKASVINGFWALARKSVFIGSTQADNPLASNAGAFNPIISTTLKGPDGKSNLTGLACGPDPVSGNYNALYCLSHDEGVSIQLSNFSVAQRFFSVYDGPAYQDSNAYLNIRPTYLTSDGTVNGKVLAPCQPDDKNGNPCVNSGFMNAGLAGVLADQSNKKCYLPNAAIGWKQPNGFYYSPAFHSTNLFFDSVDIRHFVTEPLFALGTFDTDVDALKQQYCFWGATAQPGTFTGFTDIDRETVLNDDDGSLTGLTSQVNGSGVKTETISVNKEAFFDAPVETPECSSDLPLNNGADAKCAPNTAKTSPYEYVTTALYPACALTVPLSDAPVRFCADGNWGSACTTSDPTQSNTCVGVPLFRQLLTDGESAGLAQQKRMMGQNTFQRSGLTVNHGSYYIDTTVSKQTQQDQRAKSVNTFVGGQKYDLFFLYAKKNTAQTYTMFVGKGKPTNFGETHVAFGHVDITTALYTFKGETLDNSPVWPTSWGREYSPDTGILTLTTDMQSIADDFDITKDDPNTKQPVGAGLCQPKSFCRWLDDKCQCAIEDKTSYLYNLCHEKNADGDDAICSWSVKDLDCPAKGCPALEITFDNFQPDDAADHHRPIPALFSADPSYDWNVPFNLEDASVSGQQCHYTEQPPLTCP